MGSGDQLERIPVQSMSQEDWLRERRKSIGGSDIGALLGLNPYRSPYSLWADKTGRLAQQPDTEAMRQGRDLEDYVARRFMERSGKKAERVNYLLRSRDCPWLHANIDRRLVGERSGLECKTASALALGKYKGGRFPESYYAQCASYLAVTGWQRWYLAALVLNKAFFIYQLSTIEEDAVPEWCDGGVYVPPPELAALKEMARDFWEQYVLPDMPPPPDGSAATTQALEALLGQDNGGAIELFGRKGDLDQYFALAEKKRELEAAMEAIRQGIMEDMGQAGQGFCGPYTVRWKSQGRRVLDPEKLRAQYPALDLSGCWRVTASRPMRITKEEN